MSKDLAQFVRETIRTDNHILTARSLEAIRNLSGLEREELYTPEYGQPEYLLNCDPAGKPVRTTDDHKSALGALVDDPPWIRIIDGKVMVLRWLAHFAGLRHRAIHLFLDHPTQTDLTFLSLRSLSKYNQPGLIDTPVAGHVDQLDSTETAVRTELHEELGLNADTDLDNLRVITTYNIEIPDFQTNYDEVEFSVLYRATVKPEALSRIQMQEEEVGGVLMMRRDEVSRWLVERPEQVGGGLRDTWSYID